MIVLFEGTPGSGKSYEACVRILDNLKKGREVFVYMDGIGEAACREIISVYTGLYGKIDEKLHYIEKNEIETSFNKLPKGAFYVLDEVQKVFGNRDWQTKKNKDFAEFCSTHRHDGIDILLITQDIGRLDTAVRSLIEWTYRFRKVNFLGGLISKKYMEYVYPQDDVTGAFMSRKTKTYDAKIFPCYKSYTHQGIKEQKIVKGTNVLKHPIFLCLPVLLIIGIWQFSKSSIVKGDLFGSKAHASNVVKEKDKKAANLGPVSEKELVKIKEVEKTENDKKLESTSADPPGEKINQEVKFTSEEEIKPRESEKWLNEKLQEDKERFGKKVKTAKIVKDSTGRVAGYWMVLEN